MHDPEAATPSGERILAVALLRRDKADALQRKCHVMLPAGLFGISFGDAFPDGQRSLVALERLREIVLSPEGTVALTEVGQNPARSAAGIRRRDRRVC